MRIPSRTAVIIESGLGVLLLIAVLILQVVNWRTTNPHEFEKQHLSTIESLNTSIDAVRRKFDSTGENIQALSISEHSEALQKTLGNEPETFGRIYLQGISWSDQKPLALANGRIYQIGEKIAGLTLKEITPETIRLEDASGNSKEIQLMEEFR